MRSFAIPNLHSIAYKPDRAYVRIQPCSARTEWAPPEIDGTVKIDEAITTGAATTASQRGERDENGHLSRKVYSNAMTLQYLTDDQGQKTAVVIPIADYEQLMEDVEDLACVAERRDDERVSLASVKARLAKDGLLPN